MNHSDSSTPLDVVFRRDGETYDHDRDGERLQSQHDRVFDLMKDGRYRTLAAIRSVTSDPEASISARLRDFKKPRFGGHGIYKRHVENGLWEYRLVLATRSLFD